VLEEREVVSVYLREIARLPQVHVGYDSKTNDDGEKIVDCLRNWLRMHMKRKESEEGKQRVKRI